MRKIIATLACMTIGAGVSMAEEGVTQVTELKDKISYSVGYQIGGDMKKQGVDIDPDMFLRGMRDAVGDRTPLMEEGDMRSTLVDLKQRIVAYQQEQMRSSAEKNSKEGEAFLEQNKGKEGVVVLPSGLQYKVLAEGSGASPKATDSVTVNYRGTLINGSEFDSSYSRKQPATFRVDGVIPGWTEALQLMKEGAKWQIFIPSNLAYGDRGAGPRIGPNSTLIFEVELLSVNKEKEDSPAAK